MEKVKTYKEFLADEKKEYKTRIEIFKELFAEKLKELRADKKLSQKEVADNIGCAVSTYANWEQGRREPSIFDLKVLMEIFEVDANELFNF